MRRLAAIDLFCGAGGLSLGLRTSGFDIVAAVDNDIDAAITYEHNFGHRPNTTSISDISGDQLCDAAQLSPGQCILLAGGPPCQGFSFQRRGPRDDARNSLVLEFVRLLEHVRPRFFVIENVGALFSKHGKRYLDEVFSRAASAGYYCQRGTLDAVHFGVAQFRSRAFIVGEMPQDGLLWFTFPQGERDETKWRTVRDTIADLPSPPDDGSSHPEYDNHYREARLSARNLERLRHIPPGGGREDLPSDLQLPCHINNPKHRHLDVYGRLRWDAPAGTLTARFDSFTRGRYAHPEEHRSLTLREGARLQSFPDFFRFFGSRESVARQIGNAVPPNLGAAIGYAIKRALSKSTRGRAPQDQLPLLPLC